MRLSETELAWLAGLLEGEGCFDTTRAGVPRIRLTMADSDVVFRAAVLIDLPPRRIHNSVNKHGTMIYTFGVHGEDALSLMNALFQSMGGRRQKRISDIMHTSRLRYPTWFAKTDAAT